MTYRIILQVNFKDKITRDQLFEAIRAQQSKMFPDLSTFSKHICFHDETPFKPCIEEETVTLTPTPSP